MRTATKMGMARSIPAAFQDRGEQLCTVMCVCRMRIDVVFHHQCLNIVIQLPWENSIFYLHVDASCFFPFPPPHYYYAVLPRINSILLSINHALTIARAITDHTHTSKSTHYCSNCTWKCVIKTLTPFYVVQIPILR